MTNEELAAYCEPTSLSSVTVYDRPRTEVTDAHNQVIGTVQSTPHGVIAHRPHYSLADRSAAQLPGEFQSLGEGVAALLATR